VHLAIDLAVHLGISLPRENVVDCEHCTHEGCSCEVRGLSKGHDLSRTGVLLTSIRAAVGLKDEPVLLLYTKLMVRKTSLVNDVRCGHM
jgi:hypothetical protein